MGQDDDQDCVHEWRIVALMPTHVHDQVVPYLSAEERCLWCPAVRYAAADDERPDLGTGAT